MKTKHKKRPPLIARILDARIGFLPVWAIIILAYLLFKMESATAQTTAEWDAAVLEHQAHNISYRAPLVDGRSVYHYALLQGSRVVDVRARGSYTRVISQHFGIEDIMHRDTVYFPASVGQIAIRKGMRCVERPDAAAIRQQGDLLLKAHDGSGQAEYLRRQGYSDKKIKKFQSRKN